MTHYHEMPDGSRTGNSIIDEQNPLKHYHMFNGIKSSLADNNDTHTHMIDGQLTGRPIEGSNKGNKSVDIETKRLGGIIKLVKETERAGVKIGTVEGYIATWDIDRGDWMGVKDQFVKGCFRESIAEHLQKNRQIRLKDHHGRTVGGFPIDNVREDERGLYGVGEINLEVQQGFEAYALALQGVLVDFSIGFSVDEFSMDGELRIITKATIWEGSIVDEPMNPKANIIAVKSVVPYQDMQLADRETKCDQDNAIERIKEFTKSEDEPTDSYKKGFLWFDKENPKTFSGYKLPIADVIDGGLRAIPKCIISAAEMLKTNSANLGIPETDIPGVIRHVERYYAKMDLPSPFEEDDKQYFMADDIEKMDVRRLEKIFKSSGSFSKAASRLMANKIIPSQDVDEPDNLNNTNSFRDIIDGINSIKKLVTSE